MKQNICSYFSTVFSLACVLSLMGCDTGNSNPIRNEKQEEDPKKGQAEDIAVESLFKRIKATTSLDELRGLEDISRDSNVDYYVAWKSHLLLVEITKTNNGDRLLELTKEFVNNKKWPDKTWDAIGNLAELWYAQVKSVIGNFKKPNEFLDFREKLSRFLQKELRDQLAELVEKEWISKFNSPLWRHNLRRLEHEVCTSDEISRFFSDMKESASWFKGFGKEPIAHSDPNLSAFAKKNGFFPQFDLDKDYRPLLDLLTTLRNVFGHCSEQIQDLEKHIEDTILLPSGS